MDFTKEVKDAQHRSLTYEANVMQRNTMGAVAELCGLLSGTESWGGCMGPRLQFLMLKEQEAIAECENPLRPVPWTTAI